MNVELGDRVKDIVTGYEGVAISFMRCMTGCDQFAVQSGTVNADGKLSDAFWFDRHRLQVVGKAAAVVPGCPPTPEPFVLREAGGPVRMY